MSASSRLPRSRPCRFWLLAAAWSRAISWTPLSLPPFDNSAVDGYAVRHADLDHANETRMTVSERVTAGHAATHALAAGQAIRIFTGAPMPAGADTVFMQEDAALTRAP
jgi:molybdopterin molybdotransferase